MDNRRCYRHMGSRGLKNKERGDGLVKDVILLAKGESRQLCPFDAEEVWCVNDVATEPIFKGKKVHKVFRFDDTTPVYLKHIKESGAPIVSWREYADIQYPLEEIKKEFDTEYLNNTISYMIAYAIYTGVKKLRLFGVDAPYGGIYEIERSGIEYWIGRATERGMEVIPCKGSHLIRTITGDLYGKPREGKIPLYFGERLNLLNLLPLHGSYKEMELASLTRWLITPKSRECQEHEIQIQKSPNGAISYHCPKEFAGDVWLPEWCWVYVTDIMKKLDKEGKLPVDSVTIYRKMVLLAEGSDNVE